MQSAAAPSPTPRQARRAVLTNGEGKAAMIGLNALVGLAFGLVGALPVGVILTGLAIVYVASLALLEPRWLAAIDRGKAKGPLRQVFVVRTIWNWVTPALFTLAVLRDPRAETALVAFVALLGCLTVDMTRALSGRTSMLVYASGPLTGLAALAVLVSMRSAERLDWAWLGVLVAFILLAITVSITWSYMQATFRRILALRAEQSRLIEELTRANDEARQSKDRLTAALESGETGVWEISIRDGSAPPSPFLTQLLVTSTRVV